MSYLDTSRGPGHRHGGENVPHSHDKEVHHTHEGSIGNLCNDEISVLMQKVVDGFNFGTMEQAEKALLSR